MIVKPSFLEHWKTKLLVDITGDPSSPLAVIRLWSHCQNQRQFVFPGMTPAQLSSICCWGARKPSCQIAMVRSGYVDRIEPRGFSVHQWGEHNAQLLQKWTAKTKISENNRKKINATRKSKVVNHSNDNKTVTSTDHRPTIARVLDQTRPDQSRPDKTRPDQTDHVSQLLTPVESTTNGGLGPEELKSSVERLVGGLSTFRPPTFQQIECYMAGQFKGAEKYAAAFHRSKTKEHWKDRDGRPIHDWKALAAAYANSAERSQRGVGAS